MFYFNLLYYLLLVPNCFQAREMAKRIFTASKTVLEQSHQDFSRFFFLGPWCGATLRGFQAPKTWAKLPETNSLHLPEGLPKMIKWGKKNIDFQVRTVSFRQGNFVGICQTPKMNPNFGVMSQEFLQLLNSLDGQGWVGESVGIDFHWTFWGEKNSTLQIERNWTSSHLQQIQLQEDLCFLA